jgi:hypothetical protein
LSYHATDIQPRARWAVLFSGFKYFIIYIPQSIERPIFYCSPTLDFCLAPGIPQEPNHQTQPPIWSILVYMLLVETFNISDNTLREKLGLSVSTPGETSSSNLRIPSPCHAQLERCTHPETLKTIYEADEGNSHSGRLTKVRNALESSLESHDTDGSLKAP